VQGYSEQFADYTIDDFRMPPNVFDILSSVETGMYDKLYCYMPT